MQKDAIETARPEARLHRILARFPQIGDVANRRLQRALRIAAYCAAAVAGPVIVALFLHARYADHRDAAQLVAQEMRGNTLKPGEQVVIVVGASQRRPADYFRPTQGSLVLTDRRLVFLALVPRDVLTPQGGPSTFEERDFAIDTTLLVSARRTNFLLSHALSIRGREGHHVFAVPSADWGRAKQLIAVIEQRRIAVRKAAADKERARLAAIEAARQPIYYTVERGDALSSVAQRYNTTPDRLRELNSITGDRIKVGQRLLIKPRT